MATTFQQIDMGAAGQSAWTLSGQFQTHSTEALHIHDFHHAKIFSGWADGNGLKNNMQKTLLVLIGSKRKYDEDKKSIRTQCKRFLYE